jgi:hypothetical protein
MESVKQMVAQIQPAAAWAQGNLAVYQQQAAGLRAQVRAGAVLWWSCAVLELCRACAAPRAVLEGTSTTLQLCSPAYQGTPHGRHAPALRHACL